MIDIGRNVILNDKDIIGIFDLDNVTVTKDSREFLSVAEKSGKIETVLNPASAELPKSLILSDEDGGKVYISQLSPQIIEKRMSAKYLSELKDK